MIGTYIVRHPTGVFYVGQTQNFPKRQRNHKSDLNRNVHPATLLQEAYNNSPELEWEFIPTTDQNEAMALEEYYLTINKGDPNLANKHGNGFQTELVKANQGRKQSSETIEKRAEKMRSIARTDDWKNNISLGNRNSVACKGSLARTQQASRRPIIVDGVRYDSIKATAEALNIHTSTVFQRVNSNSDKFINWFYE